ncbi:hypothetical protein N7456_011228 [Penicillium angulare]|uniref:Uncharacterized protein n=1 Tax=Penicillium angulare TaxID=116970 RepID=A0A9W9ET93_9EURO|nr:hypothetical protein N7456_011228 [Penicillium angulare]
MSISQWDDQWYLSNHHGQPVPISKPGDELLMDSEEVFCENLQNIRSEVTKSLEYSMTISSIVYPGHWSDKTLDLVTNVALQDEEAILLRDQSRDFYDGVLTVYEL